MTEGRRPGRARWAAAATLAVVAATMPVAPPAGAQFSGDPLSASQWGMDQLRAPAAWRSGRGSGVVIAIVDTGVDPTNPDVAGKLVPGFDFITNTANTADQHGHGTALASIAAAATDNAYGIAGVAPDARIMPLRALDANAVGTAANVARAVTWAVDNGAQVVNLSLGSTTTVTGGTGPLLSAIARANSLGVVVVAAAGNDRTLDLPDPICSDPSSAVGVVCVAGTDVRELHSGFSNFPVKPDLIGVSAPGGSGLPGCGENVVAATRRGTSPNRCGYGADHDEFAGSSFATAFVSGVVAILRGRGMDRAGIIRAITTTARMPITGVRGLWTPIWGYGIVDASAAVGQGAPVGRTGGGYHLVASDGGIFAFGGARFLGSTGAIRLNRPVVAMASSPDGGGYHMVASDGGIFAFGNARFHGSTGGQRLTEPIVGMATTPDGEGYWLVAADGGIFAFGNARFLGSTGGQQLARPVVGMAATPDGGGYWLVTADGVVFAFGNARTLGSTGLLNRPVVGMAATPDGAGYWLVASDGGIFSFGSARFLGSTGAIRLNQAIVGMTSTPDGAGYWLVAADGGIFAFGTARFFGSTGAIRLNRPIVGMAAS